MYRLNIVAGAAVIAMATGVVSSGGAQASGLMSACKADIAKNCPNVTKGRGRIAACLIAYDNRLSGPCKTEVTKISKSRTYRKFVPASLRSSDRGPQLEAELRKVCTSDIGRLCPGVRTGKGRILACLYSRSGNVSKTCSSAAKQIADGQTKLTAF